MSDADRSPSTPPRPRTGRVPFWDNARFACIVLVVLGHAVQRLTYDSDISAALYLLVYAFHMPAFALISGYFSKSGPPTRRQMARVITDILLPYVIFELLWSLTKLLVEGRADANLTRPSWTLWFLLALAIFRLVLPYLALLRAPLLWTVALSIAVGYLPNVDDTFSLARAIGLLPFFTLGWWLRRHDVLSRSGLLEHRTILARLVALAVMAAAGLAAWFWLDVWQDVQLRGWFFYSESYADVDATQWWAGGIRLLLMLLALILSAAFFALIPLRRTFWTRFGQSTMYVYLLHSFVLYPLRESGVLRGLEPTWLWLPIVIVLSVVVSVALSSTPVRRVFRPLIEPRPRWLFADRAVIGEAKSDPTGSRRRR